MSFSEYLTYPGGIRAQIEVVRIHKNYRGEGVGRQFFHWVIKRSKERGVIYCNVPRIRSGLMQSRFYESLGLEATHEGMKLHL